MEKLDVVTGATNCGGSEQTQEESTFSNGEKTLEECDSLGAAVYDTASPSSEFLDKSPPQCSEDLTNEYDTLPEQFLLSSEDSNATPSSVKSNTSPIVDDVPSCSRVTDFPHIAASASSVHPVDLHTSAKDQHPEIDLKHHSSMNEALGVFVRREGDVIFPVLDLPLRSSSSLYGEESSDSSGVGCFGGSQTYVPASIVPCPSNMDAMVHNTPRDTSPDYSPQPHHEAGTSEELSENQESIGEEQAFTQVSQSEEIYKDEMFDSYVVNSSRKEVTTDEKVVVRPIFGPVMQKKVVSSKRSSREEVCEQVESMIARMRIFFRAYGNYLERLKTESGDLAIDPDQFISHVTGISIDIVQQCDDSLPKKCCIASLPKRGRPRLCRSPRSKSSTSKALQQNKNDDGRSDLLENDGVYSNKMRKATKDADDFVNAKDADERDDLATGSLRSHDIRQSERFVVSRGHKSDTSRNKESVRTAVLKRKDDASLGNNSAVAVTPKRNESAYERGASRCRSGRKRRPRRVFSPFTFNRKKERGLLLVGSVPICRLKFTVENPVEGTSGMFEYVRIEVLEMKT